MLKSFFIFVVFFLLHCGMTFYADGQSAYKPHIAVFFEPNFHSVDGVSVNKDLLKLALDGWNVEFLNVDSLQRKLVAESRFEISFDRYFANSLVMLESLTEDGLVVAARKNVIVTSLGRLFLRNIAMCFDAYVAKTAKQQHLYSQTV